MSTKKTTTKEGATQILLKKYYDVVGRIVSVFKNVKTKEYTISARLYDSQGTAVSFMCLSFPNRKSCMQELERYPRDTRRIRRP